jgi:exoribonuclease II
VEGKDEVLSIKWDSLAKHVGCKKPKNDIGTNVKKGDWYYSKVCKHAKNQKLFTYHGNEFIITQVAHGVVGKNVRKVVQFATMLHLL